MRTLLFVLCLALAAPASAAWHRVDTPNFIVVGDASAKELRATAAKFEAFHEVLRRMLGATTATAPVPTVVIVFPSDQAFTPFKPLYQGKPRPVAGWADDGRDANFIAMLNSGSAYDERVIFHEYTHLVVANLIVRMPLWLNEGLADFYSTMVLSDGGSKAQIGVPVREHLRNLNGSVKVPLAELLKVDHKSALYNETDRVSVFYAESWALTHMLLNGTPSRSSELAEYLRRLGDGASEVRAWEEVFGTARTENDLRRYLSRPLFNLILADFSEKAAAFSATDTELSAADSAAFLAMLQLRNLGADAAARVLAPALKAEPANPLVNAAMAQIEVAQHDTQSAERRLAGLGSTSDWFAAYTAGITLADAAGEEREHPDALAKASSLLSTAQHNHAELPNILARLVKIELLGDTPPSADARARIARARALAPGRVDYALLHAELFARFREFASARRVVGPLMTPVYPEDVRNSARRLMGGLVDLENAASGRGSSTASAGRSRSIAVPDADEGKPRDTGRQGRFIPDFRKVEVGEERSEGVLERIDCPAGRPAVFHVRTSAGVAQFEGQMANVAFIAYRNDLTGGISCGPREPMRVYMTWREGAPPRHEKIAVAVEFLPKE
jgi:hypothetical protein